MSKKNFLVDFDLYLCERYGYKDSISVHETMNGCCLGVRERDVKLYIRLWDYSCGAGGFPDKCIILVDCEFSQNQEENTKDLINFFQEYGSIYGFQNLGFEWDKYGLARKLGLKCVHVNDKCNFIMNYYSGLLSDIAV